MKLMLHNNLLFRKLLKKFPKQEIITFGIDNLRNASAICVPVPFIMQKSIRSGILFL